MKASKPHACLSLYINVFVLLEMELQAGDVAPDI